MEWWIGWLSQAASLLERRSESCCRAKSKKSTWLNTVMNRRLCQVRVPAYLIEVDGSLLSLVQTASWLNEVKNVSAARPKGKPVIEDSECIIGWQPRRPAYLFDWRNWLWSCAKSSASLTESSGEVYIVQMKWWSCWLSQVKTQPLEWCEEVIDWAK